MVNEGGVMAKVIGRTHSLSLAQDSEANRLRIYRRMQDDGIPVTIKQVK